MAATNVSKTESETFTSATLLKRDSNTGVFPLKLRNF